MPSPGRYYWDACLFLDAFDSSPERRERHEIAAAMLDDAANGKLEIVTSTLTIAEVVFGKREQSKRDISAATLKKIDALWRPPAPPMLVDVDQGIAEDARRIMRDAVKEKIEALRAADMIHVATALRLHARAFLTYDEFQTKKGESQRLRLAGVVGLKIEAPTKETLLG